MEMTADPYEQKLYQMFQSCKTSQPNNGLLDETSLKRLCKLLQLRDQGSALIASLTVIGSAKLGVSFEQFKEALLNFLGTEFDVSCSGLPTPSGLSERSLVISNDPRIYIYNESTLDDEASDREVSPKLIVGTKKYGRRSRPLHNIGLNELIVTDSDNTDEDQHKSPNDCNDYEDQAQRSSSQSEIPGSRCFRSIHDSGNKLKRCASLPARNNLQFKINLSTASATVGTQVGGGCNKNNLRDSQKDSSSSESLNILIPQQLETISAHCIIETWEMASVIDSDSLLQVLGFDEDEVNINKLTKVLEEELRGHNQDTHSNLLRALVAIQSIDLGFYRPAYRQLHEENLKLRADNKIAKQRVMMLAAEVDEGHALIEDNCKQQMNKLEQRHASMVRELTLRITGDRENWLSMTARLEAKIKDLEQEEIRVKNELEPLRTENCELQIEQQKAQVQLTDLLEKNIRLNRELAMCGTFEPNIQSDNSTYSANERNSLSDEAMLHVKEKITALEIENTQLRDKTDELIMEVEKLSIELARTNSKTKDANPAMVIVADAAESEAFETVSVGLATKRRCDTSTKMQNSAESPRIGKQRKCSEGGANSDHSGDWLPLNSELQRCKSHEDELTTLRLALSQLEKELQAATSKTSSDTRCKELENSLEQMQRAYEDCEDYWQTKLSEERQIFEKERHIYEEEQLESDKKFTDLMEKVREYEEQFSKDGRLSPIDERDILEQQYIELEAEATILRKNSTRILEEKSQQISALQLEVEDLRTRLGESVEILTGACDINPDALYQISLHADHSPTVSPISYLWHQSTIQDPIKTFDGATDNSKSLALLEESYTRTTNVRNNLTTSETSIFSTTPLGTSPLGVSPTNSDTNFTSYTDICLPEPICKPKLAPSEGEVADFETSSTTSNKSIDSQSVLSAIKTCCLSHEKCPSVKKEELKRLKFFEISLKEQVNNLSIQRDGLVMELQQLQEARPVLEKAYARTTHPTLQQRLNQLELRNRHLQNVIKQQQKYIDTLIQQSWRQHHVDLNELHGRIEAQTILLTDQTQRLHNADILVKDLYVENSHLTAAVQRLEQQRARITLIHQQKKQNLAAGNLSSLSGIP